MRNSHLKNNLFVALLLHHHADNPVLLVLVQDDIGVFGIERVEDSGIVEPFVLFERRLFFVVLRDDIIAGRGLRMGG